MALSTIPLSRMGSTCAEWDWMDGFEVNAVGNSFTEMNDFVIVKTDDGNEKENLRREKRISRMKWIAERLPREGLIQ